MIRNYHGHLSGIYSLTLHPTLDLLATGARDATCRVWDMRTRVQIFALSGHEDTVSAILAQGTDPQVGGGCGLWLKWNDAAAVRGMLLPRPC